MKLPATEKSIREIPGEVNSEIIPQDDFQMTSMTYDSTQMHIEIIWIIACL